MKNIEKKIKRQFCKILDFKKKKEYIELKNIKRILFFKVEWKIGEYIVSSFIFREIKRKNPNIIIDVFVGGTKVIEELLKHNSYVDNYEVFNRKNFLEKIKKTNKILKKSKKEKYDILFDFSGEKIVSPKQLIFMRKINAKINIGYDKDDYKIYNIKLLKQNGRMADIWKEMLKKIEINEVNQQYDIPVSEYSENKIKKYFLEKNIEKSIAVNFYGSVNNRKINITNSIILLKKLKENYPEYKIIILDSPEDRKNINEIIEICRNKNEKGIFYYEKSKTIMDAISIIKRSDIVVSPDTSIVHIGEGLNKKILAFYNNNTDNFSKNKPYENSKIIIYENGINDLNYEKIDYTFI